MRGLSVTVMSLVRRVPNPKEPLFLWCLTVVREGPGQAGEDEKNISLVIWFNRVIFSFCEFLEVQDSRQGRRGRGVEIVL